MPQTLAELAKEQANNPNNPWIQSYAQGMSGQTASVPPPAAPNASVQPVEPGAHATRTGFPGAFNPNKPTPAEQTAALEASGGPPAPALPGAPVSAPVVVRPPSGAPDSSPKARSTMGGGGGGSSGPKKLDATHQYLQDSTGIMNQENANLDAQAQALQGTQDYIHRREDQAYDMGKKAEIDRFSAGITERTLWQKAQYYAHQKQIADEKELQLLRQEKPDPNHWFKEKGTAGSILAAISIGAGAFAAAMPHTNNNQNQAMKIIGDAIDRDVDAQKDDMEKRWKLLNISVESHDKEYVHQMWQHNQRLEAINADYDHAMGLVSQYRLQTSNEIQGKQLDNILAGLSQKKLDNQQKIAELRYQVGLKDEAAARAAQAGALTMDKLRKDYAEYQKDVLGKNAGKKPGDASEIMPFDAYVRLRAGSGSPAGPGTANSGPNAQAAKAAAQDMVKNIDEAQSIMNNPGYANSPEGRARLDELQREIKLAYPRMNTGSTRINEKELEAAEEATKGLKGILRIDPLGQNAATLKQLREKAQGIVDGGGVQGGSSEVATPEEK